MYGDTNCSAMWTWDDKKLSTPGRSMSSTHSWKKIDPFLLVKDGLIWDWKVWLCESTPASWLSPHPCSVVWDPQTQVQHQIPHHLGWLLWVVNHPATTAPANTTRNIQTDTLQQTNKPKNTHTHTHNETSEEFHVPRRKMVAVMMVDLVRHWTHAAFEFVQGLGFRRRRRRRRSVMI